MRAAARGDHHRECPFPRLSRSPIAPTTEKSPHWRRVLSRHYSEKLENALRAEIRRERCIIALSSSGIVAAAVLYALLAANLQLIVDLFS